MGALARAGALVGSPARVLQDRRRARRRPVLTEGRLGPELPGVDGGACTSMLRLVLGRSWSTVFVEAAHGRQRVLLVESDPAA